MARRRPDRRVAERSVGPRQSQGPRGRRGPKGPRGETGPIGRRGKIGKAGRKGPKGLTGPLHRDNVLDMVMTHFDDVYQQLNIQMKRMAQMQQQVDVLVAHVARLTK
jgi:hypothetical protein